MLKTLLVAGSLLIGSFTVAPSATVPATRHAPTAAAVYVCISKSSVAYHASSRCAGLSRCTHEVRSMSTSAAQQQGKRACQKCY